MTTQNPGRGDVAVLVPAAGHGIRLGAGPPKALRELGGVPLLVHALRRLCQAPSVATIVVAAPVGRVDEVRALMTVPPGVWLTVLEGGHTRQASVRLALAAVPAAYQVVLVHDAARAFAPPELVERVAAAVRAGAGAVIPVLPVVDTIKRVDDSGHVVATLDRGTLRVVQTPQGFARSVLEAAHADAEPANRPANMPAGDDPGAPDDAALVERLGVPVVCVPGSDEAIKITNLADLAAAERLMTTAPARTLGT